MPLPLPSKSLPAATWEPSPLRACVLPPPLGLRPVPSASIAQKLKAKLGGLWFIQADPHIVLY